MFNKAPCSARVITEITYCLCAVNLSQLHCNSHKAIRSPTYNLPRSKYIKLPVDTPRALRRRVSWIWCFYSISSHHNDMICIQRGGLQCMSAWNAQWTIYEIWVVLKTQMVINGCVAVDLQYTLWRRTREVRRGKKKSLCVSHCRSVFSSAVTKCLWSVYCCPGVFFLK